MLSTLLATTLIALAPPASPAVGARVDSLYSVDSPRFVAPPETPAEAARVDTSHAAASPAVPDRGAGDVHTAGGRPVVRAARVNDPPAIDGDLSEREWAKAEPFTRLVQRDPREGAPASQRTEIRVLYDDDAIYVGAQLFDSAPDSVTSRLARRDASIAADRFGVYLDPYFDRRTGYYFMVNAAGTLYDGTLFNDVDDDDAWDGVWTGRARRNDQGWSAEMRIPYSQLRSERRPEQRWGINFLREIPRRRERDFAVYRPRRESGFVSRFADLTGLVWTGSSRAIEFVPYATTQREYLRPEAGNPFDDGSRWRGTGGGDLKVGIGSRLTLNATFNPDFGQVEVDPSVVNLTDYESFFDDKRPFFVEGAQTFDFGRQGAADYWDYDWDDPLFFYSRRVGREPQGKTPSADYEDVPVSTRILGAAKLIGRLGPSWTIGSINAVTNREHARLSKDGESSRAEIEPLTYYGATCARRDFANRRLGLGLLGTAAVRSFDAPALESQINRAAWLGGVDGWLALDPRETWVLSGWSAFSRVEGTAARLIALQRSSTHYFQRPDAGYVEVDSTATMLTGHGHRYWLNKQKGAVQFNAGFGAVSPGFEVNDVGYQKRADRLNGHVGTGYKWSRPGRLRRYQSLKTAAFATYDYGRQPVDRGVAASSYTEFQNGWTWGMSSTLHLEAYDDRGTRGGPLMSSPLSVSYSGDLETDSQRPTYFYLSGGGSTSRSGQRYVYAYPGVGWRPTAAFNVRLGAGLELLHDDAQYVTSRGDTTATGTYGRRYVFAALDQTTVSASLRLNWTFTPTLSLQTYTQPFVSAGKYADFKSLVRAGGYEFEPTTYGSSLDGTDRSLKGNAVLRWEYRPGSTLFLVWTQKRSQSDDAGEFSLGGHRLLETKPRNVFLAKLSYYVTP